MKLYITAFVFLMCTHVVSAQKLQETALNRPVERIVPLNTINTDENAECYPFLTPSGLHLYYTKSVDNMDVICFAERKSVDEAFTDKGQIVLPERGFDQLSCWVSANELQLCFVSRGDGLPDHDTVFLSERSSVNKPFVNVTPLILETERALELICTASLTPDGNQLFLTVNTYDENEYLQFVRKEGNTFSYVRTLPPPKQKNMHPGTGRLSADGLRFYMVLTNGDIETDAATYQVACYKRTALNEDFGQLEILSSPQKERFHQPSETHSANTFLCTFNTENNWFSNDLAFVELGAPAGKGKKPRKKGRQ